MDWRKRLLAIAVAGGGGVAIVTAGCAGGGTCNANPDPCCKIPEGQKCQPRDDCEADGGTWAFGGQCILEAGPDANGDAADQ